MKKNILFISEMPAVNTHASSVVFYRHFKNLEENGVKIHILIDENSYNNRLADFPASWNIYLLPNRKWFFPPYKPFGLLQKLRFTYYYHLYVKQILVSQNIDLLMSFIYGQFLSPFAAFVKSRNKIPLVSFFHDDPVELDFNRSRENVLLNTTKILEASDEVLIASEGFYHNWNKFRNKFVLLPPVPEYFTLKDPSLREKTEKIVFGYSGALYQEMLPYFDLLAQSFIKLGHQLIIIGNNPEAKQLEKKYPEIISYHSLFKTAEEANLFIIKNCDAFVIPYPSSIEKMPWIKTCFPSKFIQISQLKIPVLIIAPEDSAIGEWCLKHHWLLYLSNYETSAISNLIAKIHTPEVKDQIKLIGESLFNPTAIHQLFAKIIHQQN